MRLIASRLAGVYVIEPDPVSDERGFFARTYCSEEFELKGLNPRVAQCNISYNARRGTLRGMHYQVSPRAEAKLVRCTHGTIFDVVVDLRPDSATFRQWFGVELTRLNRKAIYVPEGLAHGFLTLADDTEVLYQMSEFFHADFAEGIRWDDPVFSIQWPGPVKVISERDRNYRNFAS